MYAYGCDLWVDNIIICLHLRTLKVFTLVYFAADGHVVCDGHRGICGARSSAEPLADHAGTSPCVFH